MKREETFTEAALAESPTISGLRHLSMSSIALLQMTGNPLLKTLLNNEPLPDDNNLEVLKFIYIHTAPFEEASRACMLYSANPFLLNNKALAIGENMSPEDASGYILDILRDRDNINNSRTNIIEDSKKGNKRKNLQSRACSHFWRHVWQKIQDGAKIIF